MLASHHNHPEIEERAEPQNAASRLVNESGKHWKTYPTEWHATIYRIAAIQAQLQDCQAHNLEWSDATFTEGLPIANVWTVLRRGLYPFPARVSVRDKWEQELARLEESAKAHLLRLQGAEDKATRNLNHFVETKDYKAIKTAIKEAQKLATEHDPDRAVAFIAKTGGGKTTLANKLIADGIVHWHIEATPSWKVSYRGMLISLAAAWAIQHKKTISALDLETLILAYAQNLSGVLIVEEVDAIHSMSQHLLKLLLNRSSLVIGIFITPEARDTLMNSGGSQLSQFFRRFEAQIEAADLKADDVHALAPHIWDRATTAQRLKVAQTANQMGSADAVKRISKHLTKLNPAGPISDDTLDQAIRLYRKAVPIINVQRGKAA